MVCLGYKNGGVKIVIDTTLANLQRVIMELWTEKDELVCINTFLSQCMQMSSVWLILGAFWYTEQF